MLLALVDVGEDDVDDDGGNLSHKENFFGICLLIWNDSSEKKCNQSCFAEQFFLAENLAPLCKGHFVKIVKMNIFMHTIIGQI